MFEIEDQTKFDEISGKIKLTVLPVGIAFLATSAFRVWQISTNSKNIKLGIGAIIMAYAPGYEYYSYWRHQ